MSQLGALQQMTSSNDFRSTIDTSRQCKGYIIAADSAPVAPVKNEITGDTINVPINVPVTPLQTKTAITASGYVVVYVY